jgi:branched-chain amino acid transport system permease protein
MILVAFVLLVPKGLVPTLAELGHWLLRLRARREAPGLKPKQAKEV